MGSSTSPWDISVDGLTTTLRTYTVRIDGADHKIDIYPEFNDPEAAEHRLATTYANDVAALQKYLRLPDPNPKTWRQWDKAVHTLSWQGDEQIASKLHASEISDIFLFLSDTQRNRASRRHLVRLMQTINGGDTMRAQKIWMDFILPNAPSTDANQAFSRYLSEQANLLPPAE